MKIIGIDQSINSTGVCIYEEGKDPIYYCILPKLTKKQKAIESNRFRYITYTKSDDLNMNVRQIAVDIMDIALHHQVEYAVMEAPAFNASGRVVDLSILNGYIRALLDIAQIKFTTPPPTTVKKFFTGNGQADKEVMIYSWSKVDKNMSDLLGAIKKDDIADSYAMAVYGLNYFNN